MNRNKNLSCKELECFAEHSCDDDDSEDGVDGNRSEDEQHIDIPIEFEDGVVYGEVEDWPEEREKQIVRPENEEKVYVNSYVNSFTVNYRMPCIVQYIMQHDNHVLDTPTVRLPENCRLCKVYLREICRLRNSWGPRRKHLRGVVATRDGFPYLP
ncbi:hypothetical protein QE152_g4370 [Popillia japonica]|uniref:Uncharacterized protein n=1 Tax=Popillia japonica TaxID=7064 RepID=A0AAW1N0V0_POPJA